MRNLIIVGNGLSLSIDNDFFRLPRAMSSVWESDRLMEDEKELIRRCLPVGVDQPTSEDHLSDLQRVVDACETVLEFEQGDRGKGDWLTDTGQAFPDAIRYYVHAIASEFHPEAHDPKLEPSGEFLDALNLNMEKEGSTIATTNYDGSLYRGLCDRSAFQSYATLDGFQGNPVRFHERNLHRRKPSKGYYLHLHGTPLFVEQNGGIEKVRREHIRMRTPHASKHIVLTHARYKTQLIGRSALLSQYWTALSKMANEFARIVWIGHSGSDHHLNSFIARYFPKLPILVVEWSGMGNHDERLGFWQDKFTERVNDVVQLDDLTSFSDW